MKQRRFDAAWAALALVCLPVASLAARRSPIATNLAGVADWTTEYPFVNHFKMARPWFSANASHWEDTARPLLLDSSGHVKALAPGQYARSVLFAGSPPDPGLSSKRFVVLFSGSGTLEYGNVQVVSRQPGKDTIQLKTVAAGQDTELIFIITLTATNPANPLRALRVLPAAGGICAGDPYKQVASAAACNSSTLYRSYAKAHAEILFMPQFLAGLRPYRMVRFMDWQRTNNAEMQRASQRAFERHTFWTTDRGVPLETMIRLANTLGVDPWICIPHKADDQLVTTYAQIVKSLLAPRLRVHVEYSNEVWNGMFSQTQYALEQGTALKLDSDRYTAMAKFYSRRSQQIFAIFKRELGGTRQLRRVMATQAVVPYFTQQILSYGDARRSADLFAIAPYFGTTLTTAAQAAEVKRLGVAGVLAWLKSPAGAGGRPSNAVLGYGSLADVDAAVAAQVAAVRPFGINLTSYEGGQHLVAAGGLTWDAQLNAILDAANRHAGMKQVYLQYLSAWRARTGQPLTHYVHCDRWSVWGRWGAKEYPSQPRAQAPKLDALLQYASANPLEP
ncbi:Cellulose-binding domain [Chlorella sorokiniana]|uniref:Cellulose-binding domain n=1 Tax=Chlorella sorokiniana TaxID=3076 RepID=A0A2P6TU77_CHLSO|nr:Cellulose-binding domain [Chlorella sorokiniana]|eukprot:PRW57604.1 Cellulose-binding domain [Chlorella sorokiniana]